MNERIEKIKTHFKENKKVYIGTGIGIVVGTAGTCLLGRHVIATQKAQNIALLNWKPFNFLNQTIIVALGDPGDVVKIVASTPEWEKLGVRAGMLFPSRGALARALDTTVPNVSGHLNGNNPNIKGLIAEVVGKAGQPLPI